MNCFTINIIFNNFKVVRRRQHIGHYTGFVYDKQSTRKLFNNNVVHCDSRRGRVVKGVGHLDHV